MMLWNRWRWLALLFAGNLLFGAGFIVHAFSFNFYLRDLGLSATAMGHQVTAMTTGGLLALLPAGLLIDRVGTRATMVGGVIVATFGLILTALARDPAWINAAAVVVGAGAAACRVTLGPAVMRLSSPGQRARAFTWNVAVLVASAALWNRLAGTLPAQLATSGAAFGLTGTQMVLLGGAAITALAIPCYWALPLPPAARRGGSLGRLPAIPHGMGPLLAAVTVWMLADSLVQPFFNIYFADRFAQPVAWIGSLFAVALLLRAVVLAGAAELAGRLGPPRALTWWVAVAAPSLAVLAVTMSLPMAVGMFVVYECVAPATNPLIDQLLLERVRDDQHGVVAGWRNASAELAGAVGATAGGHLLAATSFTPLLMTSAVVAAVGGFVVIRALRTPGSTLRPPDLARV